MRSRCSHSTEPPIETSRRCRGGVALDELAVDDVFGVSDAGALPRLRSLGMMDSGRSAGCVLLDRRTAFVLAKQIKM